MSTRTDKQRIVALQKALRVAKEALIRADHSGRTGHIEEALWEISRLDLNSKPDLVLGAHQAGGKT